MIAMPSGARTARLCFVAIAVSCWLTAASAQGAVTFTMSPLVSGPAGSLATADADRDGWDDLLTSGSSSGSLFSNLGGGAFAPASVFPTGGFGAFRSTASDFNGDGSPDLATANFSSSNVSILLRGSGSFTSAAG